MANEKLKMAVKNLMSGNSEAFAKAINEELDTRKAQAIEKEYIAFSSKKLSETVETIGHAVMVADMTRDLDLDGEDDDQDDLDIETDIEELVSDIRSVLAGEQNPEDIK